LLRNDDKGEDSACLRAGARRMPEIFMLAPHAPPAKCPVGYVRPRKPVSAVDSADYQTYVIATATNQMQPRQLLPPRDPAHPSLR
jgi:hypothetical protein